MNETILGWFKREHPEELWAVGEMPPALTFRDMKKSMAAGQGMGEAVDYGNGEWVVTSSGGEEIARWEIG